MYVSGQLAAVNVEFHLADPYMASRHQTLFFQKISELELLDSPFLLSLLSLFLFEFAMDAFIKSQGGTVAVKDERLVAKQHIATGTILMKQTPLASVPQPTIRGERCNYCLRKTALQCCSRCHSAYFCSTECFRNAWVQFHRVLCEPQDSDVYVDVDADRWLLERTALTLHSHNRLSKHHSHTPPALPAAMDALERLSPAPLHGDTNPDMAAVATALEPFGCQYSKDQLVDLWHRIKVAAFNICDHDQHMDPVALGVYPITPLVIAHSCRPNAGIVYKRGAQHIVALQDIPSNEPITISYVDLVANKQERQTALKSRFGESFQCKCVRCEGDMRAIDQLLDMHQPETEKTVEEHCKAWNVLTMTKKYTRGGSPSSQYSSGMATPRTLDIPNFTHYTSRILAPEIYQHHHHGRYTRSYEADSRRVLHALVSLLQIPSVPAFTLSSIREARRLLRVLMAQDRWVEASRVSLYLYVVYSLLYPPLHPILAYHTVILARSSWNSLVQLELAGIGRKLERIYQNGVRTWIDDGRHVVQVVFGQDCSLWREIIELQWIFERDQKLRLKE
ncbi:hypothetical protein RO3G_02410 [Lichtheimia corymbifera JMRC:FSU:9682]|uniref:MYND-type domain-containing protein n=1 Tax=Lichtheimia corymbifera JMRC:FSU:9682 TaxID=1263082 RepID=A0A068RPF2_9FUNG|nr:hypothetical protein RO3G_02410 [Lichtheimia corymbifera JMRC:FSU:9682]